MATESSTSAANVVPFPFAAQREREAIDQATRDLYTAIRTASLLLFAARERMNLPEIGSLPR